VVTLSDGRSIALLEVVGPGSFGTVHRGLLESGWGLKRPVAVKVLSLPPDQDPKDSMRHVAQIARRWVSVRHPAVIQLVEVDRTEGIDGELLAPFLVTEFVEGESLASLVEQWRAESVRVPIDFATVVTLRTAEALGAALFSDGAEGSLTGLVHGDLSPRQILVSNQGEVKVGDFGLAPLRDQGSRIRSRTAHLAYTAPEIATGGAYSPHSDVFSLGVLLHELLVGPRFPAETPAKDVIRMVRDGELHTSLLEPNLPRSLRTVIDRATARNPLARYPHARAMAFDLRREMLTLGLCDAQTCIRHAIVGWCDVRGSDPALPVALPVPVKKSGVIPRPRESGVELRAGHAARGEEASPPSGDTLPSIPFPLRR
jgi:eukaryotic-like serine/threonine-protein kinase